MAHRRRGSAGRSPARLWRPDGGAPLGISGRPYLADRNFALAALLLVLLIRRSWAILAILLLATAVIHLLDAVVDVPYRNPAGVAGSLVFPIIFVAAAAWLFKHPTQRQTSSLDDGPRQK